MPITGGSTARKPPVKAHLDRIGPTGDAHAPSAITAPVISHLQTSTAEKSMDSTTYSQAPAPLAASWMSRKSSPLHSRTISTTKRRGPRKSSPNSVPSLRRPATPPRYSALYTLVNANLLPSGLLKTNPTGRQPLPENLTCAESVAGPTALFPSPRGSRKVSPNRLHTGFRSTSRQRSARRNRAMALP
jgi:hypothetical protein